MAARKENNWTQKETAEFFDIGLTTIKDWCRLLRKTGSLEPLPRGPGPSPLIGEKGLQKIKDWIAVKPDLTIEELCKKYSQEEKPVSTSTISRAISKLGLSFKKKSCQPVRRKKMKFRGKRQSS